MHISKNNLLGLLFGLLILVSACREDSAIAPESESEQDEEEVIVDPETYPDWSDETHSKSAELNYDIVFQQDAVLRIDLKISDSNWSQMQSDLATNLGSTGGGPGGGGPGGGGPGGGTSPGDTDFDPIWVPCSFTFNDTEWYNVGVRYKGNSSLKSAYQSGNQKLSFKLDFDEFEDDYPALKNQRFYGFKQLNLNNNFDDASLLREKVASDLFRQFGLVSAQTSFCEVYVDNGSGPQYFGLYTIVEEMDDTVVETQLSDYSGNLYKPDGDAASFANGTYDNGEMEKKNNEEVGDYSDIKALYSTLNSSTRTSNVEQWKSELETIFNVDGFMRWLAANTTIQNWDTYGRMTHNYYLYNNPANNLLTWIPWDNNEAFQEGKQGGALSFSMNEVASNWPLINYLMQIPEYENMYKGHLEDFADKVFIPSEMNTLYSKYYDLLKEYAYAERSTHSFISSNSAFDNAIEELNNHVQSRNDALSEYLTID
ncbi:CotH kinase family protein [Carboxylicivirga sp. M1479]|uniref:CotH kinase family protein n=1 Tax=Carboxylicivirga sp. M1479 TaxID=2594476 RepID=UPI00117818CB|nr:CotH kinase family protein [Carboxylicivirga sp. M1479]TRX71103.1 spore coat protein [Carboxylicivirga sp. M1479]